MCLDGLRKKKRHVFLTNMRHVQRSHENARAQRSFLVACASAWCTLIGLQR